MALLIALLLVLSGAAPAIAADPPTLSDVEKLKVENLTLKAQLARAIADADACRVDLGPTRTRLNALVIDAEANTLAAALEAAHPGFTVNRQTWTLTAVTPAGSPGKP